VGEITIAGYIKCILLYDYTLHNKIWYDITLYIYIYIIGTIRVRVTVRHYDTGHFAGIYTAVAREQFIRCTYEL